MSNHTKGQGYGPRTESNEAIKRSDAKRSGKAKAETLARKATRRIKYGMGA